MGSIASMDLQNVGTCPGQGRVQGGATGAAAPPSGNLTPCKAIKIMIFI